MAQKRPRRSREELRELMLDGGRDVLFELEPTIGFEGLTYSAVFAHLLHAHDQKVTIGSVHERLWKSQRDFQLDVIAHALEDVVGLASTQMFSQTLEQAPEFDLSTVQGRRDGIRTMCRLSSRQLFEYEQPHQVDLVYVLRLRLWETGPDHPEAKGFIERIREVREASNEAYTKLIKNIVEMVGLRVKATAGDPEAALREIALLGNASRIGLETDALEWARTTRHLPTGSNGEIEEWYPDALALWSFVSMTLELDGDCLSPDQRRLT